MKHVLILVVMLFGAVLAQSEFEQQMLECSAVSGDSERLECYDDLARQLVPPTTSSSDSWFIQTEVNPVDDSTSVFLYTEAIEGEGRFGEPISLMLMCRSGEVDALITWNYYLGLRTTEVTYRIGTEQARTDTWYISNDSEATFYSQSESIDRRFIQELTESDNGQLLAQVVPYNENRVTAVFDIAGLESIVGQLYEACPE
jgi:type VI secretion system protein VasI